MEPSITSILVKTAVTHTVTYTIVGLLAYKIFDYPRLFATTKLRYLMRHTSDPVVRAGPLFQPIRGLVFGVAFVLLRQPFFTDANGWLLMWLTLICLGVVGSFGPTTTSIEGMIFTTLPMRVHLTGLPEILVQSFFLSFVVFHWVTSPGRPWFDWPMWTLFTIALAAPLLGLILSRKPSGTGKENVGLGSPDGSNRQD